MSTEEKGVLTDHDKHVVALHRYFIWADRMRVHFNQILRAKDTMPKGDFNLETFLYISYWYGGMYVVIEGWKELKLSDPQIESLLHSPNVELLRRYRNGAFHFQQDYFDQRFLGFMEKKDTVSWIRELREQFSRYFLDWVEKNRWKLHEPNGDSPSLP